MDSLKNKFIGVFIIILIIAIMAVNILYERNIKLSSDLDIAYSTIKDLEDQKKLSKEIYEQYHKEMENVKAELNSYKEKYQYLEEDKIAKDYLDTTIPDNVDASIPR